jgi:SAM-dependent methyltransferase
MHRAKTNPVSGRDHYANIYQTELELEAEWLRYGAISKVDSIEMLLRRNGIKPLTLLELGCGTGAVITECQRRRLAAEFTAVDFSEQAIAYLESHSKGIYCVSADITDPGFTMSRSFDIVILSHVLEHLEDPLKFLQLMIAKIRFRYLVAEVPLEDLLAARIKNLVRDRTRNVAGHVQFFTERTFRRLLSSATLDLTDSRRYVMTFPPAVIEFVCKKDGLSKVQTVIKKATYGYLPRILKPLWERAYHAHWAVLCTPPNIGLITPCHMEKPNDFQQVED